MADDNIQRSYRSNAPYRRDVDAPVAREPASAGDPLVELARLIGQSDPFSEFGKSMPARAEAPPPAREQRFEQRIPRAAPPISSPPTAPMDWRKVAAAMPAFEELENPHDPEEHAAPSAPPPVFPPRTFPRATPMPVAAPAAPRLDFRAPAPDPEPEYYEDEHEHEPEYEEAPAMVASPATAHDDSEDYYHEDAALPEHEEETYDDAPRLHRHGRLLTAVVLIGCATLGTAGAYGYRTYYGGAGATGAPPVISADKSPVKVVANAGDAQSNKPIQDRMADAPANERLVSREEKPIELAAPGTAAVPRVVLPSPLTTSAFPPPPVPPGAAPVVSAPATVAPSSASTAPVNPGEPKRIRTVAIKPDGTDAGTRPAAPPPAAPAGQISSRSAPPAPAARTPAGRSAPLSLDPSAQAEAVEQAPPPAPARQRAPAAAPAPSRVASIAPSGSGGYMVQLSSQRSEAEAHASFRSLQGKFKDLAGQDAVVRRADLGSKGTYYRAMVGPFGSAEEANRFCGNLKAAGGQCLIQKN